MVAKVIPPMAQALEAFWSWIRTGGCMIKPETGKITSLRPNKLQKMVFKAMYEQALSGEPVRIIGLKARKMGFSTFIQALNYFLSKEVPHFAAETIAHSADSTASIFGITRRMLKNDPEPVDTVPCPRHGIEYAHDSSFTTQTAGGHYVGSGGNIDGLHLSELAKYAGSGNATIETMLSVLNSVQQKPKTLIIIESTANASDDSGEFERRYRNADMPDSDGGFKAIFIGWHTDERYRIKGATIAEHDDYERDILIGQFGCDDEQIAWYRRTLMDVCGGNRIWMGQEYPSTPEEAFKTAVGKVYPALDEERHTLKPKPAAAVLAKIHEYRKYRAIDFGGSDPFVCLWVTYTPGKVGFSIDKAACPNTWREMTGYARNLETGKPKDKDNHTCDCIRYVITTFELKRGHVHVYREMYWDKFAHRGLSELDCALEVKRLSGIETYLASVADRSRPSSITLFGQQGVYCCKQTVEHTTHRGEVEDGIAVVSALIVASVPLFYPPEPEPIHVILSRQRRESQFDFVVPDARLQLQMADYETSELAEYPWFGSMN